MTNYKTIDMPETFYSRETGRPFESCLICDRPLHEGGAVLYLIEKAYRDGETLYDYAMCLACHAEFIEGLSTESMAKIEQYFSQRVDFQLRNIEMMAIAPDRCEPWIDHCVVTREPIAREDEHQVFALCTGTDFILGYCPYAVCSNTVEDLYQLLSKQTKDDIDRFTREHLGLPPELLRDPHNLHILV